LTNQPRQIRLAAVGDLLLVNDPRGIAPPRPMDLVLEKIKPHLRSQDFVLGNLECTLPGNGATVSTEPRVIATESMIRAIRDAGFNIVSLANNHTFDCRQEGFETLRTLLNELEIAYFGAGNNLDQAEAPAILEKQGIRIAFLGAVEHSTGVSDPAEPDKPGMALFNMAGLTEQIAQLRSRCNHVIVSLHWGEERLDIPSPGQVEQAPALIDAGASLVLGHHTHVLQGMERYKQGMIVYSLGNFIASEVYFTDGDAVRWNRKGRTGCLLQMELDANRITEVQQIPTCDSGTLVEIDSSGYGARHIARLNRAVQRGITENQYHRERFRVNVLVPAIRYLRWSKLKTLRWKQIRKTFAALPRRPCP